MAGVFDSGLAADLILALIAIEALVLAVLFRHRLSVRDVLLALLPGVCLVVALRAALVGASWPWIAVPLIAALPLHLLDLAVRMRR